ncbi:hypothetical protein BaRGS_00029450 [Batillaria attramentaria]|uniref:Uncharacterized protein n=1 Tax=Batillaria attramentaria TaxID=370345 RepID=A0ABD0JXB0_9CAEN
MTRRRARNRGNRARNPGNPTSLLGPEMVEQGREKDMERRAHPALINVREERVFELQLDNLGDYGIVLRNDKRLNQFRKSHQQCELKFIGVTEPFHDDIG